MLVSVWWRARTSRLLKSLPLSPQAPSPPEHWQRVRIVTVAVAALVARVGPMPAGVQWQMRATAAPQAWYGADHGHLALFVYASSIPSEGMSTLFFLEVLSCVHVTLGSVVERVTLGPGKAPPGSLTGPQRAHWQRRRRGHHLVVLCRVRAYRGLACICTDSAGSCWVLAP